jgi:hypothetical protein
VSRQHARDPRSLDKRVASGAGAVVAVAQFPAPPAGNYGGGAVVAPPKRIDGPGNMLVGVRVRAA